MWVGNIGATCKGPIGIAGDSCRYLILDRREYVPVGFDKNIHVLDDSKIK
jgi:hypothetical protein